MVSQFISKEPFHTVVYDYFLNTKLKLIRTFNDLTSDLQSTIFTTYSKPVEIIINVLVNVLHTKILEDEHHNIRGGEAFSENIFRGDIKS